MIRDAIEYIVNLGKTQTFEFNGDTYTNDCLKVIKSPEAAALHINTLNGIMDYLKSDPDEDHVTTPIIVNVLSHEKVQVMSKLFGAQQREFYLEATPCNPTITFDRFMDVESFNIQLQSGFVRDENVEVVLRVIGNITDSQVMSYSDDGISQAVTAKKGIARVAEVPVPNPVYLRPFRTFPEIEQPESPFVLRMADGPKAALFCADGGAWKLQAIRSIKDYLSEKLSDQIVDGRVIIIA